MPTMSRYAQELCSEIVQPLLSEHDEHSCHKSTQKCHVTKTKSKTIANLRKKKCYKDSKPIKYGLSKIKTSIKSSTDISGSDKPRTTKTYGGPKTIVIKEARSRSLVVQRNVAVNTQVTGPLTCEKFCVTSIRKRNGGSTTGCPCGKNRLKRCSPKQIQTPAIMEKACQFLQSIETANCGTQLNKRSSSRFHSKHSTHTTSHSSHRSHPYHPYLERFDVCGARRWAVNRCAPRGIWGQGPDF